MKMTNLQLEKQAKKAYELARLRRSYRVLVLIVPLVIISIYTCAIPSASIAIGLFLGASTVYFLWHGLALGRSVRPGLTAGIIGFALPLVAHALGYCCSLGIESILCFAAGVGSGTFAAATIVRDPRDQILRLSSAGLIAVGTGSLGCLALGVGGVVGIAAGVAVVMIPIIALNYSRA